MKKQILLAAVFLLTCCSYGANAQIGVHVNIGLQPIWGPVGYDYVNYYYMPDIDAYYDVPNRQYVYFDHGAWITAGVLPPRFRNFDLYHSYKVVVNDPRPWMHADRYRRQYAQYRGRHDQGVIRDSHENKYRENPGHPEHNQWHHDGHGHDEGHRHDEDHR